MPRHRRRRASSVINLNTGHGAKAGNHPYPARTPVLMLDFGATSVLVTTTASDTVTASDVDFARELASEAHAFAVSVERMFLRSSTGEDAPA
ncbi:hypothetical protein ABGB17_23335 [Sphaerisporangium sp. B11E5]|uniref:hypothetical protein n=1 Tax=Sphaerisporangium sp. B11E5 TaxID=3153563 RepID=UPI00325C3528